MIQQSRSPEAMAVNPITRSWAAGISLIFFNQTCMDSGAATYGRPSKINTIPMSKINNFMEVWYHISCDLSRDRRVAELLPGNEHDMVIAFFQHTL